MCLETEAQTTAPPLYPGIKAEAHVLWNLEEKLFLQESDSTKVTSASKECWKDLQRKPLITRKNLIKMNYTLSTSQVFGSQTAHQSGLTQL